MRGFSLASRICVLWLLIYVTNKNIYIYKFLFLFLHYKYETKSSLADSHRGTKKGIPENQLQTGRVEVCITIRERSRWGCTLVYYKMKGCLLKTAGCLENIKTEIPGCIKHTL